MTSPATTSSSTTSSPADPRPAGSDPGRPATGIRAHVDDHGVAWVVFDSPARRNALSPDTLRTLVDLLAALGGGRSTRAVVLTGAAGSGAFASGFDLSGLSGDLPSRMTEGEVVVRDACAAVAAVEVPVVAMIDGHCLGGGLSLALEADIRWCSPTSVFGIPAARIGIGYGNVGPLVRAVGSGRAAELLFAGGTIDASEALAAGLVNAVVPTDLLEVRTSELVERIAANAPLAVRAAKLAMRASFTGDDVDRAHASEAVATCMTSADVAEGVRAFGERRPPTFTGE